ncbi:D-alanyl-D-alanine carboxypeptidase [Clostridium polyendosporum]|uniref:D-alanyl-D-alanine carboxypeptidase n=1 Tax=Clostridium polyendosporum TaxID=69208 RepID=A0A919S1T8_9CLOT|nr:D-alanyl-D-alanine carboxypeptidase family protein [Clostridium polyendosporum]GIM30552.1 D-alanyl-D-alanine carboxypeptidase [Clostridium polyendosporum]
MLIKERLIKYIAVLSIFFFFSLSFGKILVYAKDLTPEAHHVIAIDSDSKQVLYEKNGYNSVPMASTTKILTALIALNSGDINRVFTVSKNATAIRGSKIGFRAGEQITLHELLFGLMMKSGNDAAITIAEGLAGSVDDFSKVMNSFAENIGLLNSHFQTPHGLDMEDHYSSAYDLAIATSEAMKYEKFREIVAIKEISKEKYKFTRDYRNINKILWIIPNANGVKTGYTGKAGKCLVSSIDHKGRDVIIVVLNSPQRWRVTEKVYKYVGENYDFMSVSLKDTIRSQYKSLEEFVDDSNIDFVIKKGESYQIKFTPISNKTIKGNIIGKIAVYDSMNNVLVKKYVYSNTDKKGFFKN